MFSPTNNAIVRQFGRPSCYFGLFSIVEHSFPIAKPLGVIFDPGEVSADVDTGVDVERRVRSDD